MYYVNFYGGKGLFDQVHKDFSTGDEPRWMVFRMKFTSQHRWGWFSSQDPRAYVTYTDQIKCFSFEDIIAHPSMHPELRHYLLLKEI